MSISDNDNTRRYTSSLYVALAAHYEGCATFHPTAPTTSVLRGPNMALQQSSVAANERHRSEDLPLGHAHKTGDAQTE